MKFTFFIVFNFITYSLFGQDIQSRIDQLLRQQKLAGAVYTTIDDDNISHFGSGFKNLETGEKIDKDDKVNVGSITKTVVALGILRLATENRLQVDDPIKRYLPDLPINNPWENTHQVTIRHLLDHTSGLSDIRLWHFFSTGCTPITPLHAFYKRSPDVLSIKAKPGTLFSYSNMGYTLLGMLIEAIVKEPYETYLDKNLLRPLGLKNSTFHFVSQHSDQKLAMGHFDDGSVAPSMPTYVRPAGQFTTTAYDMGLLLQCILNKGKLNGNVFINEDYIDLLGVPLQTIASKGGLTCGYAFGALSKDRHGMVGIVHSGNTVGFRAMYYIFPKHKKAFFIAHNMDSETADYEVFNDALIDYLDMAPTARQTPSTLVSLYETSKWAGYYVPVITRIEPMELLDIISTYTQVKNGSTGLLLAPFQKKEILLSSDDNRLFWSKDKVYASHLFYEDEDGQRYLTSGILTLKKINGWKLLLITSSFLLGCLACLLVISIGGYGLIKQKSGFYKSPLIYSFITLLLIIIAAIAISLNDITLIGNRNFSTILLYGSTILLPIGTSIALLKYAIYLNNSIKSYGFWAVVFIAQFIILLWSYGAIPFATWK